LDKEKAAWFINEQQLSYSKWIIGLSTAVISFTFFFLFNHPSNLTCKCISIYGLILLVLTVMTGVIYVYIALAGLGYRLAADISPENLKDNYKRLAVKHEGFMKYLYPTLTVFFLLGLLFVGIFVIINVI